MNQPKTPATHRLLVPIDGSESAARALDYAIKLAKRQHSLELHLVTIYPEPVMYGEVLVYVSHEKMEELQKAHCMDFLKPAMDKAKAAGAVYKGEVLTGETAQTIAKRAEELDCEGIVTGTRGMTGIGNLVMGSVATKVLHLTHLPVTLVR